MWLLVWGAHQTFWKPSASAGSGVPSLADQALRFVGLNRDHLAVGFLFGATAIGAFLTVVRHEVGLARQSLDLERWRRQRWEDYLAPTLERPLEPARTGDAP